MRRRELAGGRRELGRERRRSVDAGGRARREGRNLADPADLRLSEYRALQRQWQHRCGRELHLRRSRSLRYMRGVLLAGVLATLGTLSGDQDPAIMQVDRGFIQAVAKADTPALAKLLDADFTWTDFEGRTRTRDQVLRDPPQSAIANENTAQLKQY